jgi:hypothetical protein
MQSRSLVLVLAAVACASPPAASRQDPDVHPLSLDRTGIEWVYPFAEARARAEQAKRLLMIKPIAFGTNLRGDW